MDAFIRRDNRLPQQIRPISIIYDAYGYADASLLFSQGNTKVLVGVTLQPNVPPFLKGQRTGWLSAEYAMLPIATQQRTQRESSQSQRNARSVEISRLIGRSLRPCVDLAAIGERSIIIDCDVLQADGGTRVACITAASLALTLAAQRWLKKKMVDTNIIKEHIAAVSVGIVNGFACSDLAYVEDNQAEADFNFIFTQRGELIEIQGTSEKKPLRLELFEQLKNMAIASINDIFTQCQTFALPISNYSVTAQEDVKAQQHKPAFFSLGNRTIKSADSNSTR